MAADFVQLYIGGNITRDRDVTAGDRSRICVLAVETLLLHGGNWLLSDFRSLCVSKDSLTCKCLLKNPLIFASLAVCLSYTFFFLSFFILPKHLALSFQSYFFKCTLYVQNLSFKQFVSDVILRHDFRKFLFFHKETSHTHPALFRQHTEMTTHKKELLTKRSTATQS